jgi:hypothetical protein
MSSVTRFLKQIPSDSQYFIPLNPGAVGGLNLNIFNADAAASTTSYVSGAAAGYFSRSNIPATQFTLDASGTTALFRDMGKTIISSGRTFRRVQLLTLDSNGQSGWTSSNTAGVWEPSSEGITGSPATSSIIDNGFGAFYFETGARGLGIAQGLVRYG